MNRTLAHAVDRAVIRLVAGRHDLFTSEESVAELWEAWNRPPIDWWPHGHISILFSWSAMRKILDGGARAGDAGRVELGR